MVAKSSAGALRSAFDASRPWRPSLRAVPRPTVATISAVAVLGLFAIVLRTINLASLPSGLHGDEAVVGLEAERVLREGWIGLYSPFAAGQPAIPLYLWAPFAWLFDNGILTVRVLPALIGSLTTVLVFLVLRRDLGFTGAFVAALLLGGMVWHLHYSRIAFPVVFWPLLILVTQWALVRAFGRGSYRWWIAAGALAAFGVYVYNAHWIAGAAIALAGVGFLVIEGVTRGRQQLRRILPRAAVAGLAALIVLGPILYLLLDSDSKYSRHFERDSFIASPAWEEQEGFLDRAELIADRYARVWQFLLGQDGSDNVDAGGAIGLVSASLLLLAGWGLASGWHAKRYRWWWLTSLALLLVMPLASVLSIEAVARRPFAMSIALVVLAGIAVADLESRFRPALRPSIGRYFPAVAAVVAVLACIPGLVAYFSSFADNRQQRWVFLEDFSRASLYMAEIGDRAPLLVSSYRHSVNYETRQYLAPEVQGSDWAEPADELPEGVRGSTQVVILVGREQERAPVVLEHGGVEVVSAEETDNLYTVMCLECSPELLRDLREIDPP